MSVLLDRIINFLKWPVAIYLLLSVPALVQSFSYFNLFGIKNVCFFAGMITFFAFKATLDKDLKSALQVLGHEITHAFFAFITFHKVTSLKTEDGGEGSMSFEGKGNWLIVVAPYFFPLFLFFVMIVLSAYNKFGPTDFLGNRFYVLTVCGVLGALLGAHLDMIGSQIHDKQTDLAMLGIPFCIMFIIPANIWVVGSVLAFNSKGFDGFFMYFDLIFKLNEKNLNIIF